MTSCYHTIYTAMLDKIAKFKLERKKWREQLFVTMNAKKIELDKALLAFEQSIEMVDKRIARMEEKVLPQLRARKLHEDSQLQSMVKWFSGLTVLRENPKLKYVSNQRYQNACSKIAHLEEELTNAVEEESSSEESTKRRERDKKSSAQARKSRNCDRRKEKIKSDMLFVTRSHLILNIRRILPQVRQCSK